MNIGISHKELSGILSGCSLIGATLWMADVLTWQAGYFITAGLEGLSLIVYYREGSKQGSCHGDYLDGIRLAHYGHDNVDLPLS